MGPFRFFSGHILHTYTLHVFTEKQPTYLALRRVPESLTEARCDPCKEALRTDLALTEQLQAACLFFGLWVLEFSSFFGPPFPCTQRMHRFLHLRTIAI